MKSAIAWFANNHIAANLLLVLIVLSGLVAIPNMPQKSFPDIDVPIINVTVAYLGAAPEEIFSMPSMPSSSSSILIQTPCSTSSGAAPR
ncbi:MAG: efflux RND transporter permease subunit [Gammaproteobacteria bacterium]|nr:efflux RND transporter permease subunit [Gammaproteobacteria bacterium]